MSKVEDIIHEAIGKLEELKDEYYEAETLYFELNEIVLMLKRINLNTIDEFITHQNAIIDVLSKTIQRLKKSNNIGDDVK